MALSGTFFDADYYFAQYSDVAANWSGTGLEHYTTYGASEGRAPNSWFNYQYYRSNNSDLQGMTALQLFEHYENYGYAEGRIPSSTYAEFDAAQYLANYSDLSAGGITTATALWHYLVYGQNEGRTMPGGSTTSQTFTLTANQDIFTGGSGTDIIRGVAGQAVGNQDQTTLNSSDILDGGAGEDKLVVNMTGANYTGGATIKNIETLQIGSNINNATFDYNINAGSYEITGTNKIIFDQITTGEVLNVTNIVNTAEGDVIPTLSWENEAGSGAGFSNVTFRQAAISGTTTELNVDLNNVAGGNLGIAAGVETLNITSAGSSTNTLSNNLVGNRDGQAVDLVSEAAAGNGVNDDSSLTKVVVDGDQLFGTTAGIVATAGANLGLTNHAANSDVGILAETPDTQSNLVSVAATVTEIDATNNSAGVAMRFTAKQNGADTNVTFKGGAGTDYVEFERGNVSATGGAGDDTFAFVVPVGTVATSGFTSADSITGGEGTDTIQIGLNGVGNYTLNTTEFNNKTGIDVLDLRGTTSIVTLSDSFVAAADTTFTVRTDKIVQTSLTSSANATGSSTLENQSVHTVYLTQLADSRAINYIGGSGSDRLVGNNASINSNTTIDGGTGMDSLTVLNTSVLDHNDLANIKGIETLNLVESVTGASTFDITIKETFLANNTASGARNFVIASEAAAGGTQLNAGDTVNIDVSDLYNADGTVKTSVTTAGYILNIQDIVASGATVVLRNGSTAVATYTAGALAAGALPTFSNAATNPNTLAAPALTGQVATNYVDALPGGSGSGGAGGGGAAVVSNTFTLTSGNVILTTTSNFGTDRAGTTTYLSSATDTINAGANLAATTVITDATAGDADVLNATVTAVVAPIVTGVETINVQSFAGGLNLAAVTGNTLINVSGVGATFTNAIANEAFAIGNTFAGTLDISGTAGDTYSIATTGVTATLDGDDGGGTAGNSFSITNSGTSALTIVGDTTAAGNTDVTLAGSGVVTLTVDNVVNTITATTYTGALTLTTAVVSTVTGGSGVDTLTIGGNTADSIFGGAGDDIINATAATTAAASIRGGQGNDTISLDTTPGGNTAELQFEATSTLNGSDVITGFAVGAALNKLDFRAFVSGRNVDTAGTQQTGGATVSEFSTASAGVINVNNCVVAFDGGVTALTTTELAAEFAAGQAFSEAVGQRTVILEGNTAGATRGVNIYYVFDADSNGDIAANEIVLVGTLNATTFLDLDTIFDNQIL